MRSAIRGILRAADAALATELRGILKRDDDCVSAGKPTCDWDDDDERERLVDALVRDAFAVLAQLDNRTLSAAVAQATKLLATVAGQDIEAPDGLFRIANRVAKNRTISTVDPEARHGHKTESRGFDGFKGHVSVDPDSEIITATSVTPHNVGDADAAKDLLEEALGSSEPRSSARSRQLAFSPDPGRRVLGGWQAISCVLFFRLRAEAEASIPRSRRRILGASPGCKSRRS